MMRVWSAPRRSPMAVPVLAIVLAFAVVCPIMAAPGIPDVQGCHGGTEPTPVEQAQEVVACCSSVTVPKSVAPAPRAGSLMFPAGSAAPLCGAAAAVESDPDPASHRRSELRLFLICASLLI